MCEVDVDRRLLSLSDTDLSTQLATTYRTAQQGLARVAVLAGEAAGRGLPRRHGAPCSTPANCSPPPPHDNSPATP